MLTLIKSIKSLKIYIIIIFSMIFWGMSFVWYKIVVKYYEPFTIIFLRLIISSALLLTILFLTKKLQTVERKHLKYFFLLAFSEPFCYFLGESFGLKLLSSTSASVIISTIPLFTPFAAYYFVRERVNKFVIIGLIISFIGIITMILNPDFSVNINPVGLFLLFIAVFSAVAYSIIVRKIPPQYSSLTIITYQNIIGAIYFLPLFLIFDFHHFIQVQPNNEAWLALLQLAVFASTLAFLFYVIAIKEIGITKAGIFTNLIPVFTGIFSFLIIGEQFTALKLIGMSIVLFGVVVSQIKTGAKIVSKN